MDAGRVACHSRIRMFRYLHGYRGICRLSFHQQNLVNMSLGRKKEKTEGGQGGKRGHSNMTHWDKTELIKVRSNKLRRRNARQIEREARLGEIED